LVDWLIGGVNKRFRVLRTTKGLSCSFFISGSDNSVLPVLNADKATQVTGKIADHFTFGSNVGAPGVVFVLQGLLPAHNITPVDKVIVGSRPLGVRLRPFILSQELPFTPDGCIPYGGFVKRFPHFPQPA